MRDYAKVGGRKGMPGYRTPAVFKYKSSLKNKVLQIVSKIPKGRTMTYKKVAELSGAPKACRAVGNILHQNYDPSIPCHRVIRSDGKIGGYNRGAENKKKLLRKEGVV
jgi:O-6-methylguanine DNA methyltransferase